MIVVTLCITIMVFIVLEDQGKGKSYAHMLPDESYDQGPQIIVPIKRQEIQQIEDKTVDLQTSDLPFNWQQITLPQYRSSKQTVEFITRRPNNSYLFSPYHTQYRFNQKTYAGYNDKIGYIEMNSQPITQFLEKNYLQVGNNKASSVKNELATITIPTEYSNPHILRELGNGDVGDTHQNNKSFGEKFTVNYDGNIANTQSTDQEFDPKLPHFFGTTPELMTRKDPRQDYWAMETQQENPLEFSNQHSELIISVATSKTVINNTFIPQQEGNPVDTGQDFQRTTTTMLTSSLSTDNITSRNSPFYNSKTSSVGFADKLDVVQLDFSSVLSESMLPGPLTTLHIDEIKPTTTTNKLKIIFPSRHGGKRKTFKSTTIKNINAAIRPIVPTIRKGWPSKVTTEFTGWPTSSTGSTSIKKTAGITTSSISPRTVQPTSAMTTTTKITTTTRRTTPGICFNECALAGTLKVIKGIKWIPEFLNIATKEWQNLANIIETELIHIFKGSSLNQWVKKIRIDGFSEGSVLVDYFVKLNNLNRTLNTLEIKRMFHNALKKGENLNRGPKYINNDTSNNLKLGHLLLDSRFTEFVVLPEPSNPILGHTAEEMVFLPQWAIAVIVVGALFVIIFGLTIVSVKMLHTVFQQKAVSDKQKSKMMCNHQFV